MSDQRLTLRNEKLPTYSTFEQTADGSNASPDHTARMKAIRHAAGFFLAAICFAGVAVGLGVMAHGAEVPSHDLADVVRQVGGLIGMACFGSLAALCVGAGGREVIDQCSERASAGPEEPAIRPDAAQQQV